MEAAYRIVMALCTVVLLGGFIGAFAAHMLLQFRIDHNRVLRETGEPGWKVLGSMLAPVEFYKDDAKLIWKIRRAGFIAFLGGVFLVVIAMVVGAALGIKVQS